MHWRIVEPALAGPKRPQDRVALSAIKQATDSIVGADAKQQRDAEDRAGTEPTIEEEVGQGHQIRDPGQDREGDEHDHQPRHDLTPPFDAPARRH